MKFKNRSWPLIALFMAFVLATPFFANAASPELPNASNFDSGKSLRATDLKALLQNVVDLKSSWSVGITAGLIRWGAGGQGQLTYAGNDAYVDALLPLGDLIFRANGSQESLRIDGATLNVGIGVTSPSQKLEVAGNVKASGFCIGTACITSWPSGGGTATAPTCTPRVLWLVNPGSGVWAPNPGVTWLDVYVIGGGGGGGGNNPASDQSWTKGGDGGASSFDQCVAGGGTGGKEVGYNGGGGVASGGDIGFLGGNGSALWGNGIAGGAGGTNLFGGSAGSGYQDDGIPGTPGTGAGGAGAGATSVSPGAAGAGAGAVGEIFVVPAAGNHTYAVGAGGYGGPPAGPGGFRGGAGGSGAIIIKEYCDAVKAR